MPTVKGSASYKKKDGTLNIANDQKTISWTPIIPPGAAPAVVVKIAEITNLQQTPESSPKVALKLYEKKADAVEPVVHVFSFTSVTDARGEANSIKEVLSNLIAALKAGDAALLKPNGAGAAGSMAMATAANARPPAQPESFYDDAFLKSSIELQASLMRKDPALQKIYAETRQSKPDTVSDSQFNAQFWSSRTNLLRAHAVEASQKRGEYNVLSVVKPRTENGELKLRVSKDQIALIFSQHPLVRRVYDENVPKLDESQFWARFFQSRLSKKLKGERVTDADNKDPIFDRYLDAAAQDSMSSLAATQVPNMIDLEGNEENQGGAKSGNRQDFTMRPASSSKAPIIRTLNSISTKILANVAASDINPAAPIGMDETTYNEFVLRDLQGDPEEARVLLKYKEQSQFQSNNNVKASAEAMAYSKQDPVLVLSSLSKDVSVQHMGQNESGGLNLRVAIGVDEDSDSDAEVEPKKPHVGSRTAFQAAQQQVWESIKTQRTASKGSEEDPQGLSTAIFDKVVLANATTVVFLAQFWSAFLSGDAGRAEELAKSVESLDRCLDRMNAIATDAEEEREAVIKRDLEDIRTVYERTGKKMNRKEAKGGAKVVKGMLQHTFGSVEKATTRYREALAAEGVDGVA